MLSDPGPEFNIFKFKYIFLQIFNQLFVCFYCQIIVEKIANRNAYALAICNDAEANEVIFKLLWSGWSGTVKGVAIFPLSIWSGQMVMVYLS